MSTSFRLLDWDDRGVIVTPNSPAYDMVRHLESQGWIDISLPREAFIFGRVTPLDLNKVNDIVDSLESEPYDVALDEELLKWDSRRRMVNSLLYRATGSPSSRTR